MLGGTKTGDRLACSLVLRHPDYRDDDTHRHDVMLLRLAGDGADLRDSSSVVPACLQDDDDTPVPPGIVCITRRDDNPFMHPKV